MANNGSLLGMSGGPGGVLSSRVARFFIFVIIACVVLLTYQVWVLTKRCGMYENRMISYDAQLHRLDQERSIADKRANSYRQQAIQFKESEGKVIREAADARRDLEGLRRQVAEVKVSESKAQQELETAKQLVNDRNEFVSKRETSCRSDISQLMQELESCKNKLTPYQRQNQQSKPLEFIASLKNDSTEPQVSKQPVKELSVEQFKESGEQVKQQGEEQVRLPVQQTKLPSENQVISSRENNALTGEKERSMQEQPLGQNELLIREQERHQNERSIQKPGSDESERIVQEQRQQIGQNERPIQGKDSSQNEGFMQVQQPGKNERARQEQQQESDIKPGQHLPQQGTGQQIFGGVPQKDQGIQIGLEQPLGSESQLQRQGTN